MKEYEKALQAMVDRTQSFMSEDMNIELVEKESMIENENKFHLFEHTAIIGLGGNVKALTIFSFDASLVNKLTDLFIYGDITNEERDELIAEIPAEVANTIIGNAIPNFPDSGQNITITPPIIIEDAKLAMKIKNSFIIATTIETKYGNAQCALLN